MPNIKIRKIKCPRCSKPTVYSEDNKYRPFCTERCQIMDTAGWADESFRIAGDPAIIADSDDYNDESNS